ncbi:hypothetical protein DMUE_0573 [Dictyocoela muelleri]|nr:hypothetical protein DMUE_0573 [Dictyocoela muelleri]
MSLKEVMKNVEINLNFTHHTIIRASLFEFLNRYSIFDVRQRNLLSILKKNKTIERCLKENEINSKNRKRIISNIKISNNVLRKNFVQDKIVNSYLGPFEVIKFDKEKGRMWIKENGRVVRHNEKNIKPFMEGRGCHTTDDITENIRKINSSEKIQNRIKINF